MDKRIEWIDIAKFYGILLVIIGHCGPPIVPKIMLSSFHMPLFFFLSGCTVKEKHLEQPRKFIKSRVKGILVPYFLLAFVMFIWKILQFAIFHTGSLEGVLKQFLGIFVQCRSTGYAIGLWFLPCLFVTELIFIGVQLLFKHRGVGVIFSVIFIVGLVYGECTTFALPWGIDAALIASGFMYLGARLKQKCNHRSKYTYIFLIVLFIIEVCVSLMNYTFTSGIVVDMWSNEYGIAPLFVIGACAGIGMIIMISHLTINRFALYIGTKTLYIYGIHIIFIEFIDQITARMLSTLPVLWFLIKACIVLSLSLLTEPIYKYVIGVVYEKFEQ